MLLNDAPKYGNNEPFVDEIAKEVVYNFYEEVQKYTNPRGGKFIPGLLTWTLAEGFGSATGATPDGRKDREVFSDSIGAAQGRDLEGPTALMGSVTQIDYTPVVGGLSFNMKFTPTVLSTDDSIHKLQSLIRTVRRSRLPVPTADRSVNPSLRSRVNFVNIFQVGWDASSD